MNHLAHFLVAYGDDGLTAGALLADRTKGRLDGTFPAPLERGIALHRAVDAWTDQHPEVRAAARAFDPEFRRFGPIMTDVIFDHFLARQWTRFGPCAIGDFADNARACVASWGETIPADTRQAMHRMHRNGTLARYADADFVVNVLEHLGTRLRRPNPLAESGVQFTRRAHALELHFERFMPELLEFTDTWRAGQQDV